MTRPIFQIDIRRQGNPIETDGHKKVIKKAGRDPHSDVTTLHGSFVSDISQWSRADTVMR